MDVAIDVTDLVALGRRYQGAERLVREELVVAGREAGQAVVVQARADAPRGETGRLAERIGPPEIEVASTAITTVVGAHARSPEGFFYPPVVEHGRGPVVPIRAKVLRFRVGGRTVFARRVGPAAPRPFLLPAPGKARGQIERAYAAALRRISARLARG
jgi:hypothetical protein